MKQILIRKGRPLVAEIPPPQALPGMIRVAVRASCISPGTEKAGIAASGASLLQRAWDQPEKARRALAQMRRLGVRSVLRQAREKFDAAWPPGYSAAGVVLEAGEGVEGFRPGGRVAVAGAGYACHAAEVAVPVNLAAAIPEGVGFDDASTVALGAIALQGVRRADPRLGEFVAVIGCGALGLLTVQLLKACGCRVLALDLDAGRLEKARAFGADLAVHPAEEDAVRKCVHFCDGQGADAVILTAATSSPEPLSQAFRMARRKGRVVLVGVVGREFNRDEMYAKELDFVISTSYGPGRYDESYERWGLDYPYGYVRWTERRNMEAYLGLIARGAVRLDGLIGLTVPIAEAPRAYEALGGPQPPLLALIRYEAETAPAPAAAEVVSRGPAWRPPPPGPVGVAIVGAGHFVAAMHLPNLKDLADRFAVRRVVDQSGASAAEMARSLPGCRPSTSVDEALADPDVHMVLIATRHDTHAELTVRALRAGKAVFVEKPMALHAGGVADLGRALAETAAPFMVGYNRRFSPFARRLRALTEGRVNPLMIHYTMNAGYLPYDHWTQTDEGGGRIAGEACHLFDLFRHLAGAAAVRVSAEALAPRTASVRPSDNVAATVAYADGSVATLVYTAVGSTDAPKERMEVFWDQKAALLEDYLRMEVHGARTTPMRPGTADKGHRAELEAFHAALRGGPRFPIPWEELEETWRVTHAVAEAARGGGAG